MKNYNLEDYIKYCQLCQAPLINMGGFWVHPNLECAKDDGIRLVTQEPAFQAWKEEMGEPPRSDAEIIGELVGNLNSLKKNLEKIKKKEKELRIRETVYKDIASELRTLEEKWFVRFYKWLKEKEKEILLKIKSTKS